MSHGLRTPLNSLLILARLLADNPDGNLSEHEVQFATTCPGGLADLLGHDPAGNDPLAVDTTLASP